MSKSSHPFIGSLLLVVTALIWGSAFVAQHYGMDSMGPCYFNGIRCLIGSLALLPLILFRDLAESHKVSLLGSGAARRSLVIAGCVCGSVMGLASLSQQVGIQYTSVGKAGFITVLYIMIVPVLGIFLGKKSRLESWICILLAIIGFYLLAIPCATPAVKDGVTPSSCLQALTAGFGQLNKGDAFCLLCSFLFSLHILAIEHFAPKADGVRLSALQFLVCGVISLAMAVIFREQVSLNAIKAAYIPLLYTGVLSCGVAYTLQVVAQKWVPSVVASLLMSLESCFSVLFGWLLLHQTLSLRELIGCVIIFVAVIVTTVREQRQ